MSREQLLGDVRALRHHLGELLPSSAYEGNSEISNVLSSIEGIAEKMSDEGTYRIWHLFKSDGHAAYMVDSGATQEAASPEQALEDAHRRGVGWGFGFDKKYIKAVALKIELTPEID
jgi:hypothetical protein